MRSPTTLFFESVSFLLILGKQVASGHGSSCPRPISEFWWILSLTVLTLSLPHLEKCFPKFAGLTQSVSVPVWPLGAGLGTVETLWPPINITGNLQRVQTTKQQTIRTFLKIFQSAVILRGIKKVEKSSNNLAFGWHGPFRVVAHTEEISGIQNYSFFHSGTATVCHFKEIILIFSQKLAAF